MSTERDGLPPHVGEDGVWRQLRSTFSTAEPRPILFLDRDGVVVEEVDYLHRVADIRFIEGVAETVCAARDAGWRVALVTNQAGIGRGYYGWPEFAEVNQSILGWLDQRGAMVDAVFAVPHHPDASVPYRHARHPMRKPEPGMLIAAAKLLHGNLSASTIVGDNAADLQAGQLAGLARGYHVLTGHGERFRADSLALASQDFVVRVIDSVGEDSLRRALAAHEVNEENV